MPFSINVDTAAFRRQCEIADGHLRAGVDEALRLGLEEGVAFAKQNHTYQDHSSQGLTSTIHHDGGALIAGAEYASFVDGGTRPHLIEAHGNALHWENASGHHFAKRVNHPGTAPQPFMQAAADRASQYATRQIELDLTLRLAAMFGGT